MSVVGNKDVFKWDVGDLVLLTGAGFTKNMGGLVSSDMYSQIANHPQVRSNAALRILTIINNSAG